VGGAHEFGQHKALYDVVYLSLYYHVVIYFFWVIFGVVGDIWQSLFLHFFQI
jgi:hypothetical protein